MIRWRYYTLGVLAISFALLQAMPNKPSYPTLSSKSDAQPIDADIATQENLISRQQLTACDNDHPYPTSDYEHAFYAVQQWLGSGQSISPGSGQTIRWGGASVWVCNFAAQSVTVTSDDLTSAGSTLDRVCGWGIAGSFITSSVLAVMGRNTSYNANDCITS